MSRTLSIAFGACVLGALAHARPAAACTLHGTGDTVTYWDDTSSYDPVLPGDNRCSFDNGVRSCQLQGYYITPVGSPQTPQPTIVFIHGSEETVSKGICETANAFLDAGYTFFVPVLRGDSGTVLSTVKLPDGSWKKDFTNTGDYIKDWGARNATADCPAGCTELEYMNHESRDIDAAFHWLVIHRPNRTDLSRIALMGHSFGGARVLIPEASGSHLTFAPTVTVDLSGGALSWGMPGNAWESALTDAAENARTPTYFQMVINESPNFYDPATKPHSMDSAIEPYQSVIDSGQPARLAVYTSYKPLQPHDSCTTPQHKVHCGFVDEPQGVAIWSGGVLAFLAAYGVKP